MNRKQKIRSRRSYLYDDAVSRITLYMYVVMNSRIMNKELIAKEAKGSGHGPIYGTTPVFTWKDRGKR